MIRVRFAPSPTGVPHIGNTRTALYNYLFARHHGGKLILRIEDTDTKRLVPESLDKILEILKFIGINWDEGPIVGGPYGPYIQSKRLKIYQDYAHGLVKQKAAYYCFCSPDRLKKMRQTQQQQGRPPKYDRHCLKLSSAEIKAKLEQKTAYVIRLKIPSSGQTGWTDLIQGKINFQNKLLDDQILLKSNGYPTYHLAVVVDDHLMKISHILRGVEWISSIPKHILLFKAFGWDIPKMGHFPLILGPDKSKLSKRHGAKSVLDYRDQGYLAEALITFMAYLGWSYQDNSQLLSLDQLIKLFDLDHVQKSNPIFDLQKLNYFNAKCIRRLPAKKLIQLIKPYSKWQLADAQWTQIIPLIQDRLIKLGDINDLIDFFVQDIKPKAALIKQPSGRPSAEIKKALSLVSASYSQLPVADWKADKLDSLGHDLLSKTGWKPRELFMTIRVALTGKTATPPLFDIMAVLGKDKVLQRLQYVQKIT
jgi:glutamyl-tRNA synthetase